MTQYRSETTAETLVAENKRLRGALQQAVRGFDVIARFGGEFRSCKNKVVDMTTVAKMQSEESRAALQEGKHGE